MPISTALVEKKVNDLFDMKDEAINFSEYLKKLSPTSYIKVMTPEEWIRVYSINVIPREIEYYQGFSRKIKSLDIFNDSHIDAFGKIKISKKSFRPSSDIAFEKYLKELKPKYSLNININKTKLKKMKSMVDRTLFKKLVTISGMDKINADNSMVTIEDISDSVIDRYIDLWAIAKYPFFIMLGEKLSSSKKVEIPFDSRTISDSLRVIYDKYPEQSLYLKRFGMKAIIENTLPEDEYLSKYGQYKKGMKVTKYLSKLFQDNEFDMEFSKIYQFKNQKGFSVVSIDPCDYLTMSITPSNWTSCHSIIYNIHSTAPLALMIDNSTLIHYQCSEKYESYSKVPNIPKIGKDIVFNNKKYRQIVAIDKDTCGVIMNKAYPQDSSEYLEESRKQVLDCISKYFKYDFEWKTEITSRKYGIMYLGNFSYQDPSVSVSVPKGTIKSNFRLTQGSEFILCPCCGSEIRNSNHDNHSSMCYKCLVKINKKSKVG